MKNVSISYKKDLIKVPRHIHWDRSLATAPNYTSYTIYFSATAINGGAEQIDESPFSSFIIHKLEEQSKVIETGSNNSQWWIDLEVSIGREQRSPLDKKALIEFGKRRLYKEWFTWSIKNIWHHVRECYVVVAWSIYSLLDSKDK